jgi:alpha-beta hydrolase superfamily lysophospholipase
MRDYKMQHYCEIPTPKGTLRGFFHKPNQDKHPVCLIFHGFTGQKTGTKFSYVQLSRMLEAKGIASFRFDFLGSGESDGNFVDMTFQDELSCARVILEECLKMENCTEIYVLGHSMGGAVASELAKIYPDVIKKMVLWAPAFNLPDALHYLTGQVERTKTYDHNGYEISDEFVEDILKRDFYQKLDTYQNDLLVIHGTKDTTVPYEISKKYMKLFHEGTKFISIEDGNHNFDKLSDIKQVLKLTLEFFE